VYSCNTYIVNIDKFVVPKFFNLWVFNKATCQRKVPVNMFTDDKRYSWDEATTSWVEMEMAA